MSDSWTYAHHRASVLSGSSYVDEVLEPSNYAPSRRATVRQHSSFSQSVSDDGLNDNNTTYVIDSESKLRRAAQWELNYREAAIYLEEGENNDKFTSHPEKRSKLKYYFFAHSVWFNILILIASLAIMALGFIEGPGRPVVQVSPAVCGALELVFLTVIVVELAVRCAWLGVSNYLRHIRTMSKTITVIALYVRAISALVTPWGLWYVGVLRAFRPIFLLDCQFAGGTRRFVRQLLQTLPRILMMLGLLSMVMFIFAVAGYYMFAGIENSVGFESLPDSFLTMFVMLTTSNFPNVMLPAYKVSKWYSIFFIVYLVISIYLVMNLLFSVVYDWFTFLEATKLKKLYLHRRAACECAFRKLVRRSDPTYIPLRNFEGLLRYYKPSMRRIDIYLTFKAMIARANADPNSTSQHAEISPLADTVSVETDAESDDGEARAAGNIINEMLNPDERMTIDAFYEIYEATKLSWRTRRVEMVWHEHFRSLRLRNAFSALRKAVESTTFDWLVNAVVIANCAFVISETIDFTHLSLDDLRNYDTLVIPIVFAIIYAIEIMVRILALGSVRFFSSPWNIYDFAIVLVIWLVTLIEAIDEWTEGSDLIPFSLVLVLRPLRLVRLFKSFELYRVIINTLGVLAPRMLSALVVILVVYYFFGIIGIEAFATLNLADCCKNTSFSDNYRADNSSSEQGYYYLLTFDNAPSAWVTLFHLTIVNDWFVTMNAYTIVSKSQWTRLYFCSFYLVMMVVLSMVVSFILDAFVFRMRYVRSAVDADSKLIDHAEVELSAAEREMCANAESRGAALTLVRTLRRNGALAGTIGHDEDHHSQVHDQEHENEDIVCFIGERLRKPFEFSLQMHADRVLIWQREAALRKQAQEHQRLVDADAAACTSVSNTTAVSARDRLRSAARCVKSFSVEVYSRVISVFLPDQDEESEPLEQDFVDAINTSSRFFAPEIRVSEASRDQQNRTRTQSAGLDCGLGYDPLRSRPGTVSCVKVQQVNIDATVASDTSSAVRSDSEFAGSSGGAVEDDFPQISPAPTRKLAVKKGSSEVLQSAPVTLLQVPRTTRSSTTAGVTKVENVEVRSAASRSMIVPTDGEAPPVLSSSLQQFTNIEMNVQLVNSTPRLELDSDTEDH